MLIATAVFPTLAVEFGPMPACLARAATEVTVPGGNQTLATLSGGSYFVWAPGETPMRLANASLGASTPYEIAVLVGIGPSTNKYVLDYASEALMADGIWELSSLSVLDRFVTLPPSGERTFVDVGAHLSLIHI